MIFSRIFYNLFKLYVEKIVLKKNSFIISFNGGLGNQLISYFAYTFLNDLGKDVEKDISYFHNKNIRENYKRKGISVFNWELEEYLGIKLNDKNYEISKNYKKYHRINDGFVKLYLALKLSREVDLFKKFNFKDKISKIPDYFLNEKFICVHFRQGDYLKVASLLPNLFDLVKCASFFSSICKNIIIFSDEKIDPSIFNLLKKYGFENINFISAGNPIDSHLMMVYSNVLICSNSQFSFSAGLLNKNTVIIPKRWFAELKLVILEVLIEEFSSKFYLF